MKWLWAQVLNYPVYAQAVVQAIIALVVSFGGGLTGDQVGAIAAVSAAILGFITHMQVTPMSNPKDNGGRPLVPAPSQA
jgi:hypothetical protein